MTMQRLAEHDQGRKLVRDYAEDGRWLWMNRRPTAPGGAGRGHLAMTTCPNEANHTPCPDGYAARQAWFAEMVRLKWHQNRCRGCGLWAVWTSPRMDAVPVPPTYTGCLNCRLTPARGEGSSRG